MALALDYRRDLLLSQIFFQLAPVILLPSFCEMLFLSFGKTCVIENQMSSGALCLELKPGNGINALVPRDHAPGLDDSPVRRQLQVASDDVTAKQREGAAGFAVNRGRHARKCTKLLAVEQCL